MDMLRIGATDLSSRLILGTGKYPDFDVMRRCHEVSETAMVTVAIRRIDLRTIATPTVLDAIDRTRIALLPNTAGCFTAEDAVVTAELGRELLGTNLVKLEVIGDPDTLFPDVEGTLEAARILVRSGFDVLPYITDDPVACHRLADIGCKAVMPLAAPIGSGLGIRNPTNLLLIRERLTVPMIVDAGVGTASDVAIAFELGADGVLLNTAVAGARDPVKMAEAMKWAALAGRGAYEAGRIARKLYGQASSPLDGMVGS
jgi:thiazole synthase